MNNLEQLELESGRIEGHPDYPDWPPEWRPECSEVNFVLVWGLLDLLKSFWWWWWWVLAQ